MVTRVKICGITNVADAELAVALGVHALGLNFFASSPRYVTLEQAQKISAAIPPLVSVVGLFVNHSPDAIRRILENLTLDILQFHGDETVQECERYNMPYIKAIRVKPGMDIIKTCEAYPSASMILLDSYCKDLYGGTGETFNWQQIPNHIAKPLMLAGGLSVENVADAIEKVKPYAIDICGGVEAEKGVKDPARMTAIMKEVNRVNQA